VETTLSSELSNNQLKSANLGQVTNLEANILDNNIDASQEMCFEIKDSQATGNILGDTNLFQMGDMLLKDSGNNNCDEQCMEFTQKCNEVMGGNITQYGVDIGEVKGNNNEANQCVELISEENQAACGNIVQQSTIDTNA
jgi:hypothetical protein